MTDRTSSNSRGKGPESLPGTMRAMVLMGHGGPEQLVFRDDWPLPRLAPEQVLIQVGACGLNNTDVNTRTAWYSTGVTGGTTGKAFANAANTDATWGGSAIAFPQVQGADVCGRVVALDHDKCGYFGSECDGGFADYTAVHARNVHVVESALCDAELATFPTSYVTAENMLNRAGVHADDRVLITGASGGVGSALVQLSRRRGAETVALCSEAKADAVRSLGADHVLPRAPGSLTESLEAVTGRAEVTVVADVVGGSLWPQLLAVLARGGRYTCAGAIAGPIVRFDLRAFYLRDLVLTGATVVPPGTFADVVGHVERGEIKPVLAATYALSDLAAAQEAFVTKRHVGNIVVSMAE